MVDQHGPAWQTVGRHKNGAVSSAQPQPVGIPIHQTPSSPTPPSVVDSSNLVPSTPNVVINNESQPVNNITSSEPIIPVADPKKVPETLQTSSSSVLGEVMEIH